MKSAATSTSNRFLKPLSARARQPFRIGKPLSQHLPMHGGVLTHIEGGEMESKGIKSAQQSAHSEEACVHTPVGVETLGHQFDVGAELLRRLVAIGAAVIGSA